MMKGKFKAAIIGLGNIGFQFSLDPLRKGIWSHAVAYSACKQTELCAAVEIDQKKAQTFIAYYKGRIPVFLTIKELMTSFRPDIVSVCTPTNTHWAVLKELSKYPVKAVFCEKPIAGSIRQAQQMIALCRRNKIVLAINHTRRWEAGYLKTKEIILKGRIGQVKAVRGIYPAQIFNIGTHILDIIRFLISKDPEQASGICSNPENPDPDVSGYLIFRDGVACTINAVGKREDLIFEIDVIGTQGMIRISENGRKVELGVFVDSHNYSGYRELFLKELKLKGGENRLMYAVEDVAQVLLMKKGFVNCSGNDGLMALQMSQAMLASAKNKHIPVKIVVR